MPAFVEVTIDSVRVSLTNQQRIVVLREINNERYLPIWIGPYEAEAITIALQEIEVARPQTHDLVKATLAAMDARLLRVEVLALKNDVFYGNLVIEQNGRIFNIDSRPSDALALAVRAHVPVMVEKEVMLAAGIMPEKDISSKQAASRSDADTSPSAEEVEAPGDDRLSIFEDFLSGIDLDAPNDKPDEEQPGEDQPGDDKL
ncbi:MAG: bifunctional nuclease family protein [Anaerolineaceae bacterium]|jgi:bifunctional DNase/RNase|nr:bifunctional nuclease family protein [Anaerolineaceae bacterium]